MTFSDTQAKRIIGQAYFIGLALLAASLTLSPFGMSVAQFLLVGVWLADGVVRHDFNEKWHRFTHDWVAVLLVGLYLLHVAGLAYSSDFQYAFKDLRVKLPLLILPFVLSSMLPLSKKRRDLLLNLYVLSVVVGTFFSFRAYLKHEYADIREISLFISHIRFCLQIVFCIFITGYYLVRRHSPWWGRLLEVVVMAWLCYILYVFESLSGYVAFCAAFVVSLAYAFFRWEKGWAWRAGLLSVFLLVGVLAAVYAYRVIAPLARVERVDLASLDPITAQGNRYWHDTTCLAVEDGRYVGLYYCRKELQETWPQRSDLPLDGRTENGENLEATLVRYLTSKGLRKDAEGVMALTAVDVRNIEQGVANYNNWKHPGIRARLSSTLFEYNQYRKHNNPNGGSLSQRIEYTRASLFLIKQHPLFGVGTGDIPNAYRQAYDDLESPLAPEYRHKAHNQYLSITVGFGVLGLLVFLAVLVLPYLSHKKYRTYLYTVFLCIIMVSMFPEDTIETQAGVSFYALFNAVFLLASRKEQPENEIS